MIQSTGSNLYLKSLLKSYQNSNELSLLRLNHYIVCYLYFTLQKIHKPMNPRMNLKPLSDLLKESDLPKGYFFIYFEEY